MQNVKLSVDSLVAMVMTLMVSIRDSSDKVHIEGVHMKGDVSRIGLEALTDHIKGFLDQLPDQLRTTTGISVTDAHVTKAGDTWAGEPRDVDVLIAVAIGADLLEFTKPRDQWNGEIPSIRQKEPSGAGSK